MYTRTSILSASVGVLLLTAAPQVADHNSEVAPTSSRGEGSGPSTCAVQTNPTAHSAPERLSAAYAPIPSSPDSSVIDSIAPVLPPVDIEEPTLWLARAIYSETKLPHEQELVAWVIRNRVETHYRGKSTYREVVLDPYQFSAFNPGSSKRSFLTQLRPETDHPRWQQALWVAHYVRHAAPVYRPFSIQTRHFYSERSMENEAAPYWAESSQLEPPNQRRYTVEKRRFRFYKQTS